MQVVEGVVVREVVADGAAADVDIDMSAGEVGDEVPLVVRVVGAHGAVAVLADVVKAVAYRGHAAAAVDGAEHGAAGDIDRGVAADVAGRQRLAAETAAAAEDVAVESGDTVGADGAAADVDLGGAHHVAVLAAAQHRAVDAAAGDFDDGVTDVGPLVEVDALVALAGTEEVAGDGVGGNLFECARHAERGVAAEVDLAVANDIGHLVAAIDRGEDVAAGDDDEGVALDTACRADPFARCVGDDTGAAAEDVAIDGVAVAALGTGIGGAVGGEDIEGVILLGGSVVVASILPVGTLGESLVGRYHGGRGDELPIGVGSILAGAAAYLAALYLDVGVVQHMAVLAAAIDRAFDEGRAGDGDIGVVDVVEVGDIGVAVGLGGVADDTPAGAEYHADEEVFLEVVAGVARHEVGGHGVGTDDAAAYCHVGLAGVGVGSLERCGFAGGAEVIVAHGGHLAAAEDVALDLEAFW